MDDKDILIDYLFCKLDEIEETNNTLSFMFNLVPKKLQRDIRNYVYNIEAFWAVDNSRNNNN